MADEWKTIALETLVEPGRGISYGIVQPGAPISNGIPIVRVSDVRDGRIATADPLRVSRAIEAAYSRTRLYGGELLLTLVGTVGESAIVPEALAGWNTARAVAVIPVRTEIGSYWVHMALRTPAVRGIIDSRLNTTVQATLNLRDVAQLPIILPPQREREAITHILGTLDDKIELNRRMTETLEAMARALCKSWFVDFDPVRAKAEGRDPGLPKEVADLFPDSFEDSELGEIPSAWEAGPLGRFFKVGLGGAWGDDEPSPRASVAVRALRGIDCHDLADGKTPDVPVRWLTPNQAGDRQLNDGKILIEGSGSFCGRSLLWRSSYGELIGERVAYSNFCKRLDPLCTPSQAALCWLQMRRAYREGEFQAFRTGTAFPNFDVHGLLANLMVVVPSEPVADKFGRFFGLSQRIDLMGQSRTLATLRDTLLPKLISGELRVRDADKMVADGTV